MMGYWDWDAEIMR